MGGDLGAGTILAGYRSGLFPMRQGSGELAWWSPDPRGVIIPDRLHVSHSLRRAIHRYRIKVDTAFDAVIEACAERPEGAYHWITPEIRTAYGDLHRLGWAHSVETWHEPPGEPGRLVGGLYGVAIGGMFSGESMFNREPDASKVALVGLVEILREGVTGEDAGRQARLIDVQWLTPHMAALGAIEISRDEYLDRLRAAISSPVPARFMLDR